MEIKIVEKDLILFEDMLKKLLVGFVLLYNLCDFILDNNVIYSFQIIIEVNLYYVYIYSFIISYIMGLDQPYFNFYGSHIRYFYGNNIDYLIIMGRI